MEKHIKRFKPVPSKSVLISSYQMVYSLQIIDQSSACISHFGDASYISHPSHPCLFDRPNIFILVQGMNIFAYVYF
jgi:hypothetical protein